MSINYGSNVIISTNNIVLTSGIFTGIQTSGVSISSFDITAQGLSVNSGVFTGNVDVSGVFNANSGISTSGMLTATSGIFIENVDVSGFLNANSGISTTSGNFSNNVSISGTAVISGILTASSGIFTKNVNVSGILNANSGISATSGNFSNNVSISGTAVVSGIFTASSGIFTKNVNVSGILNAASGVSATSGVFSGNVGISGILTAASGISASSGNITTLTTVPTVLSPSALGTDQNDWNPGVGDIIRLSASTTGIDITGMVLRNEYTRVLINIGTANNVTLKHQSVSSTAANRFITSTGGDHIVPPSGTTTVLYDSVDSRWRIL